MLVIEGNCSPFLKQKLKKKVFMMMEVCNIAPKSPMHVLLLSNVDEPSLKVAILTQNLNELGLFSIFKHATICMMGR